MKKLVTSGFKGYLRCILGIVMAMIATFAAGLQAQDCGPIPVCQQNLVIPLNSSGINLIPAYIFDAASFSNCGPVYFKAKRMAPPLGYSCANPGNPDYLFDDFVQFCCQDIANNEIMVILRVYDVLPPPGPVSDTTLAGHFNDCMVQVEVQDKLPPVLICPSNLTISCIFPFTPDNLEVFGKVVLVPEDRDSICIDDPGAPGSPGLQCVGIDGLATDNCNVEVTSTSSININMCGVGTIVRTFTATDDGGIQSTCQQIISVINYNLFDITDITWPLDLTTNNICEIDLLDPDDLSPPYNEPLLADGPCDLVGSSYEDAVFDFSNNDQACFKILRTWTVIDWCQLNTQTYGIWTHLQVIKVMNTVPPVIAPIEDISTCSYDPQCGGLVLDFTASAEDDCSGPNSLSWKYFIDIDNDGSFDFISPVIIGETIEFSYDMPIGSHRILYTVWDLCGNITTEEQLVDVVSCKPPSAKCIHGLATNLMPMDLNGDGVADWGMVTMQAEMFDGGSDHPCGNAVTVAFSSDPNDVTRVFDCDDLGDNEIELWAIDENGLTDFCITSLEIQDNNNICPQQLGGTGNISGSILVPGSGKLSNAMIYLDGSNLAGTPSGSNGYFVFPTMPFGGNYVVRPVKEGDARNGVTTLDLVKIQKHLLGISTFSDPFQYIAADANNSHTITAIDILQLRKLILGYYDELPNNQSWRFIDEAHIFPDPLNPWISQWAETYTINPFNASMNDVNFNAVKIGDVNLSANLQSGNSIIHPRGEESCKLVYEIIPQAEEGLFKVDLFLLHSELYKAVQFSFQWDESQYEMVEWIQSEFLSEDDIRMPQLPGEGASILSFTTGQWNQERMLLLSMWVRKKSQGDIPFRMTLKDKPTNSIAYSTDQENPIRIEITGASINDSKIQNKPNPFKDFTTIIYVSNRQEDAVLHFFDLNGRFIIKRNVQLLQGMNEFVVGRVEMGGPGIYTYEIKSETQYSTNRMIIVD